MQVISQHNAEERGFVGIMVAPDNLGEINQKYGREGGDQTVTGLADYLKENIEPDEKLVHIDGANFVIIVAKGENAAVRERTGEALEQTLPREALEPKYVHPFLMGLLGRAYGYSASMHEAEQGVVHIHIKLPAA